jgi:hypothetical protein
VAEHHLLLLVKDKQFKEAEHSQTCTPVSQEQSIAPLHRFILTQTVIPLGTVQYKSCSALIR